MYSLFQREYLKTAKVHCKKAVQSIKPDNTAEKFAESFLYKSL